MRRTFRPHFRIRGNFRARNSNRGGVGRGNVPPASRTDTHSTDMDRSRTQPLYDHQNKFSDRYRNSNYDSRPPSRESSSSHYQENRHSDRNERSDYRNSSRRSTSRSPYRDYYRKHSSRYRSRSRSSERSNVSHTPRRNRSPSQSPSRNSDFESDKYERRPVQTEREPYSKRYHDISHEKLKQSDRKHFDSPSSDPLLLRKPLPDESEIEMKTKDLFSDFERARKERGLRGKYSDVDNTSSQRDFELFNKPEQPDKFQHELMFTSSLFRDNEKLSRELNLSQTLPWNTSPPPKPDLLDAKPAIKSILKKSSSAPSYDDDELPNQRFSLQSSSSSSSMFIPGLGDIEGIEDEEKFLYGGGEGCSEAKKSLNQSQTKRDVQPDFFSKTIFSEKEKERDKDLFHNFRNVLPKRVEDRRNSSPRDREYSLEMRERYSTKDYSPFSTRSKESLKFTEEQQKEESMAKTEFNSFTRDMRSGFSGKDFDDMLKSIGMQMFKQLQKKSEERIKTPDSEELAKSFGIKHEMQTSSFFVDKKASRFKDEIESLWADKTKHEEQQNYSEDVYASGASYYPYANEQYSVQDYNTTMTQTEQAQTSRTNLRVVPIQQKVGGPVAANLTVVPMVEHCSSTVQVPAKAPQRKSSNDRQSLLQQRENQYKRLDIMQKEIERLRKQQGELMRKKQKQKDGHKDPLLQENSKLQDEISRQICAIKKTIEGLSEKLKGCSKDGADKFIEKQEIQTQVEEKKPEIQLKIEHDETDLEYDYFDPGGHWCKQCNEMLPHLHNFLQHLQAKKHIQGMDPYDRPWLPEALKNPPLTKPKKGLIAAIKGVQFLKPVAAYYCSLCMEFMGDASCAELHVKSKNHNYKYLQYVLENPYYERCWNLDKAAGISVKTEEMKRKWIEDEKAQKAKRKKLEAEAEQKNRELIKAEAARDKKVHELEESNPSIPSQEREKSKNKEIKLTLKMEKKDKIQDRRHRDDYRSKSDEVFSKFTWKQKETKRDSVKEAEKEAARLAQAESAKLASRLTAAPSIPWQTIRRPILKQKKVLPVVPHTPVVTVSTVSIVPTAPAVAAVNVVPQVLTTQSIQTTYGPRNKSSKSESVDIFMTTEIESEPPPPGTNDTILPISTKPNPVVEIKSNEDTALLSRNDIADAFTGKYKGVEGKTADVVYGPTLPPDLIDNDECKEVDNKRDKPEVIILDDEQKDNDKVIENVHREAETLSEVITGNDAVKNSSEYEISSLRIESVVSLIDTEANNGGDESKTKLSDTKAVNEVEVLNIFSSITENRMNKDKIEDNEKIEIDLPVNENIKTNDENNDENHTTVEGLNKDDGDGTALEVHIENMLVLDEALFDTE